MKIRELSIKNCLSFSNKGFNPDDSIALGDFNLFIGKNNSGKSNVLRLVRLIQDILLSILAADYDMVDFALEFKPDRSLFKDWFYAQDVDNNIHFSFLIAIEEEDQNILQIQPYVHGNQDPLLFLLEQRNGFPKDVKISGLIKYKDGPLVTITKVEIPNDHSYYSIEPILFDSESRKMLVLREGNLSRLVWKLELIRDDGEWKQGHIRAGQAFKVFVNNCYEKIAEDLFVLIPPIREISHGGDIVETLAILRDSRPPDKRTYISVKDFVRELIFRELGRDQDIDFIFPPTQVSGEHSIEISAGQMQLPLNHYGSAVEQMLYLVSEIIRHGTTKVVLIEEPEAHFHPNLQRMFIRFLEKNKEVFNHQYFIVTQSSVFIDEFNRIDGNSYYVYSSDNESTRQRYSQVESLSHELSATLIGDLGLKPSDLLLANGILVVEGSTDKRVYTHRARIIQKPFEEIGLEVIDGEGAGNIPKYLKSPIIQRTCFKQYCLCDSNAEEEMREKLKDVVPDENILALDKGDLEDYYPRDIVMQFIKEHPKLKNGEVKIPSRIEEGETVTELNRLLGVDWWKTSLSRLVIENIKSDQIDDEIVGKISEIYNAFC